MSNLACDACAAFGDDGRIIQDPKRAKNATRATAISIENNLL
jgi:hypothetical protein